MTKSRAIYWTTTGLVCAVMVFSAINFNLKEPLGPMKGAFKHLGFPDYFRIELTTAKVLGVVALLIRRVPRQAKEFAYAGFAITLTSASIAHFSVGDPVLFVIDPLLFLAALVTSYVYFNRLNQETHDPHPVPQPFANTGEVLTVAHARGPVSASAR
jgi:DoxX-like family